MKDLAIFAGGMAVGAAVALAAIMWSFIRDCWSRPDA